MRVKKLVTLCLSGCLVLSLCSPAIAATTQEQLDAVRAEKASTESSLAETESRIETLESLKGDQEAYLTELNAQYEELTESLADLTAQAALKEAEFQKVKADLKSAKRQEAEQYAAMKLRIAYMYENSDGSYLTALLSSKSFTDFLNRAENIMMISKYDRDMLEEYQETKRSVAKKKDHVEKEQADIRALREESSRKRDEIQSLEDAARDEIASYQEQIDGEQSEAGRLLDLVNSQSEELNSLVEKVEAEQAAAEKAEREAKERAEAEAAAEAERQAEAEAEQAAAEAESQAEDEAQADSDETEPEAEPEQETPASGGSEASSGGTYLGNFKLTAYCNCAQCCGIAGNLTASGTWPTPGRTVAMAGVPFGTKLLINGNVYTVEDLGTPYGHVDIYCGSHSEALSFGLQYADVYQVN